MPKLSLIRNAVGKTINLARPQAYHVPRKPPLNTLIFEKLPEPKCTDKVTQQTIKHPIQTKPVRLCSKLELQQMYCPPVPCDCRLRPAPLTLGQKLLQNAIFSTKCAIVGGLIYYTWAEGLWSDSDHSECLYDRLFHKSKLIKLGFKVAFLTSLVDYTYHEGLWSDAFHSSCFLGRFLEKCPKEDREDHSNLDELPHITVGQEPCAPYIPRTDAILHEIGVAWNKAVCGIFWLFLDSPGWLVNNISEWLNEDKELKKKRKRRGKKRDPKAELEEACEEHYAQKFEF